MEEWFMKRTKSGIAIAAAVLAVGFFASTGGIKVSAQALYLGEEGTLVSPQPDATDDEDSGYYDIGMDVHSIYEGTSVLEANAKLGAGATDASYDLRTYSQVTPVRNQYSGNTCWAFAAICSAESSAIKEGLKTYATTDLSELQLAYFMNHRVDDPLGNIGTDGVSYEAGKDYDYFDQGGNDIYATMTLAKWMGVTNELPAMAYPSTYGIKPAASYDNQYAYANDSLHLENSLWVSMSDKEAIQANIVNYGSAAASIYYDELYVNTATGKKGAFYYNGTGSYANNHAISIVGWHDNYPKTNFLTQPAGNGAWLVKNSYGTSEGDAGYLWISYYDYGITGAKYSGSQAVFYDFASSTNYTNNYQYDGGVGTDYYQYTDGTASMANVFTAKGFENLGAVSFYTYDTNVGYTAKIYKLNANPTGPTDGTLMTTKTGTQLYEGYHTVKLDSPVTLSSGEKFSVVIDLVASGTDYAYVAIDYSGSLFSLQTYPYSYATCNAGESYRSGDGTNWSQSSYNCRIKAFTTQATGVNVGYRTHVQNVGWQSYVYNGATSGTAGQSLRLEGINVSLSSSVAGGIRYRTHVQNIGWQDWVNDGALSGTSAQSLRLEAIQIELTGTVASTYDVYYRVQAQDYGWLGWTKNGACAGTAGQGKRLEAIQIMVVPKGQAGPTPQYYSYVEYAKVAANTATTGSINYFTHVQSYGNQSYVNDGSVAGTFGEGLRLEGLTMNMVNPNGISGSIRYCTHVQNIGWQDWVNNGSMSGTSGQSLRLEAMKIELTGNMANSYDVYYRVHAQDFGWLGWAKNGEMSGTSGCSKRLEALQVVLVPKGQAAPGDTNSPYVAR